MSSNADAREARAVAEEAREKEWTLPSFGKSLFLGDMRLDLIYPQPKAPAAEVARSEEFLATLRDFLQENVDPDVIERDGRIPDVVIDGLKKVGALGMKIPQRYGGLGLSQVYYNRALMLVGTWHCSLGVLLSAHQSIGAPQPLLYFGSEEQKEYWLPKLCTQLSAFALTEPGVGSDPAKMTCAAVPTEDGSGYRITGRKLWTTNGTIAEIIVVLAKVPRSEGHKGGITAFIVPRDAGNIITESRNEFMGMRGIENSLTLYDGVFVPKENVIGKRRSRAEDRAHDAEHRPDGHTGAVRRDGEVVGEGGQGVRCRARPVGQADRSARRGGAASRVHRRDRVRARGRGGRDQPAGRRKAQ